MEQLGVRGCIPYKLGFESDAWESKSLHDLLFSIGRVIEMTGLQHTCTR